MDLPSRTHWRVEIRLPADRAYFETNVLWYNPTPLEQPYYNWMTAAAFARDDLEMSMPGNAYLEHSGTVRAWPVDEEGRYLPLYANNTFEGHKSYHVVGELNDFFGGYYHDDDYGFGHWARYEDMPGQKLWLWALSREGGVWEDLLTDTDGQYVEFQAGRLFVQYSPGTDVNPITQAGFDPMSASRWTETWFPLEGIGGLTDASREGALYASAENGVLTLALTAFREIQDTLTVWSGDELVATAAVELDPLKPLFATFDISPGRPYRIQLPGLELDYDSDPSGRTLARPFVTEAEAWESVPEVDRTVFQARELMKGRRFADARDLFESALGAEPWNREALLGLAEISYRRGLYQKGLDHANRTLQLDAYDAKANFLAGVLYRALGRTTDARDAFAWAARSTGYRSAAYAQLAQLGIGDRDFREAARYARLSLEFDRHSVPGWEGLAVIGRLTDNPELAHEALQELVSLDPLNVFPRAEGYLWALKGESDAGSAREFPGNLRGEYPDQTLLELAIGYVKLGLEDDAKTILGLGQNLLPEAPGGRPITPMLKAWGAWLAKDPALLGGIGDPSFAFPYRQESLPVLQWAAQETNDWSWSYLLALNLWALDREAEAATLLGPAESGVPFAPFWVTRARLLERVSGTDPLPDLQRAAEADPESRVMAVYLIQQLETAGRWSDALAALDAAREVFPTDFNLRLLQVRALVNLGRGVEAADLLAATHVLPSEGARESHRLWEQAHTLAALDAMEAGDLTAALEHLMAALEWPESLGQGRPYAPEERLIRFLLGLTHSRLDNVGPALESFRAVVEGTGGMEQLAATPGWRGPANRLDLLAVPSLLALGGFDELGRLGWGALGPVEIAERIQGELPDLFTDLEGRMLLRALQLVQGS